MKANPLSLRRFKPYPAYKDSGVEWLGEIPARWEVKQIKAVARLHTGGTPPGLLDEAFEEEGVPWVKPDHLQGDRGIAAPDRRLSSSAAKALGIVRAGSILVCGIGTVGKTGHAPFEVCRNQQINTITFGPEVTNRYGHFVGSCLEQEFARRANKVTIAICNKSEMGEPSVCIPPLTEQRVIAAFLDRETARIDALVAKKERLIELLQEKRTALISDCVTGKAEVRRMKDEHGDSSFRLQPSSFPKKDSGVEWLGEIPAHWSTTFLDKLVDPLRRITYGIVQPGEPDPDGIFMAVRYRLAFDRYVKEKGCPFQALVAFSGTVEDGGKKYTESGMNSFGKDRTIGERQTAKEFEGPEYRFLIVANKFQTGFDQPLLHTMYVDKKLGGVNAVQTLSRLNRTLPPEKKGTMVLDFANEADEIKAAFEPYYETTLLAEATDPNLLYEIQTRLAAFPVYTQADVDRFAKAYFDPKATQDQLYAVLAPVVKRFREVSEEEQHDFRGQLTDYVRLYAFLAQVLTFADADIEKLYVFARYLRRLLPADRAELPREVQQNIDMESYRIQQTGSGKIALERKPGVLDPVGTKGGHGTSPEEIEALSRIIAELNQRFGLNLGPEHRVTLGQMMERLDADAALDASARVNTRENVRLTFDQKVEHVIQEIVDSNFDLYKRITDDHAFGEVIKNMLFDQYVRAHRQAEELIKRGESKTLEFKSTLRWNLEEDRQDDKVVTHAVLKTIAAFLNTEGGDLLIGVADDGAIVGIERDRLDNDDKFMRHLAQVVRNGLGDRANTCIDPTTQIVQGKTVCVVSCQRSPEPVFLKWKGMEASPSGDLFVRSGPGTVKLQTGSANEYIRTRFPGFARPADSPPEGAV